MGIRLVGAIKSSKLVRSMVKLLGISAAAGLLLAAGPVKFAPATGHPAVARPQVNRHIHGVTPSTRAEHRDERHEHRDFHHHHPWHERWDYVGWLSVHHGTGTIIGTVMGKDEEPVANAWAGLRGSRGQVLRIASHKHITHTDSAGHFVMRHVLPGSYRLRASVGKTAGSTRITVHSGTIIHEIVHL